jgi:hypothetical protein
MPIIKPIDIDVSHITGKSTAGRTNSWTSWHSAVNTQVPFYLQAPTAVKPSVSVNAGSNVLFDKSPTQTSDKPDEKPWWYPAISWAVKDVVVPTYKNFKEDPIGTTTGFLNPTTNIMALAGKGDVMAGAFTILELPKKVVTSSLINIGRSSQGLRQLISGETPRTDYLTDMKNAWNWELQDHHYTNVFKTDKDGEIVLDTNGNPIPEYELDDAGMPKIDEKTGEPILKVVDLNDNIDVGTAFMYALGQTANIVTGVAERVEDKKFKADVDKVATEWGFIPTTSNFDIFDHDQIDQITGVKRNSQGVTIGDTGNGWTGGNVFTQAFNFTGDLALDPLSYVPFGKVGRIAFAGRNMLTNGTRNEIVKVVAKDATTLASAAAGEKTAYNNFLTFAAKSDANTIRNHVVIKSITTGERDKVAYLLGEVTKPEDAAKVLLAVEYGSVRAQQELIRDYGKVKLAIDGLHGGGYLNRAIAKGELLAQEDVLNTALHKEFYDHLTFLSDAINKSPFSVALRDTAYQITEEGAISTGTKALRELTPANWSFEWANKLANNLEAKGARIGTFFVNGITDAGHLAVERPFGLGSSNWILHQIIRVGSVSAKGVIDVSNIDGQATNKFLGALNDVDRLTRGKLSLNQGLDASGKQIPSVKEVLTQQWLTSSSAMQRAQIIEDLNKIGLRTIAIKHGAEGEAVKLVTDELTNKRLIFNSNLDNNGLSIHIEGGQPIVYHDPYAVGKGSTEVSLWNWNKVDSAFAKKGFWSNVGISTLEGSAKVINEVNGLFNALVVTRGSRTVRDIIANAITTLGSGYASQMFKYLHPTDALVNAEKNRIRNVLLGIERLGIRKGNIADTSSAIATLGQEKEALTRVIENQYQYIVDQFATAPLSNVEIEDIVGFLTANAVIGRKTFFHYSDNPALEMLPGKLLANYDNELVAATTASEKLATPITTKLQTKAEQLTMPETSGRRPVDLEDLVNSRQSGATIQVRTKGRKNAWNFLDMEKVVLEGYDLKKYEYRIFDKGSFDVLTLDDIKRLAADITTRHSFIDDATGKYTVLTPEIADRLKEVPEQLFKENGSPTIYQPQVYGNHVDFTTNENVGLDGLSKQDETLLFHSVEEYVANPDDALGTSILALMDKLSIGSITVRDAKMNKVVLTNPTWTVLNSDADAIREIVKKQLENIGFGFQNTGRESIAALRTRLENAREMGFTGDVGTVGTSPIRYQFVYPTSKNVVPLPNGWTIVSEPANGYSPKFFIEIGGQIGGVAGGKRNRYAVRFAVEPETNKIVFAFENPNAVKGIGVGKSESWYRLQSESDITLGDFIPTRKLKKVTTKASENIETISSQERRLLENQAAFGSFDDATIKFINDNKNRLDEIDRQLWYLTWNLRSVTKKLSKQDAQRLAEAEAKLGSFPNIPVKKSSTKTPRMKDGVDGWADYFALSQQQEFVDALLGKSGKTWYSKIKSDSAEVRAQGTGLFTATDNVINKVVRPGDRNYWTAWQRTLNEHWRMADGSGLDPIIKKIIAEKIENGTNDTALKALLVDWLKNNPGGIKYANEIGVGAKFANFDHGTYVRPRTRFEQMTPEDYVDMQIANVQQHVGVITKGIEAEDGLFAQTNFIAQKLYEGVPITVEDLIRYNLKPPARFNQFSRELGINPETGETEWMSVQRDFKNLPEIWGTMTDPIARRSVLEKVKFGLAQANRVLADIPQEILFQKPMFRAAYAKSLERQTTQMRIATGRDLFTQAELRAMEEKARSFALTETRKWIYSTTSTRNIMNGIRQVVPFANATVFTAKWMANVAKERPMYAAWMVYEYNKAINGIQWFDKNGNVVDYNAKDKDGNPIATHFRGNYPDGLINILAGKPWDDSFAKNYVSDTFVSRTSVDPIWNGNNFDIFGVNVPNPFVNWGLTTGPAILFSELVKASYTRPDSFEGKVGNLIKTFNDNVKNSGILPNLLPFGVQPTQGSLGLLIPGQASKLIVDDQELTKLKLDAAIWLMGRHLAEPENENYALTAKNVDMVAQGLFDLKFSTSLLLPFATKYVTEGDIARQTWQSYLQKEQAAYDKLGAEEYTKRNLPGFHSFEERTGELPGAKPYMLDPFSVAKSKFLNEHADLFYGAISRGTGDLKVSAQKKTADNLIKYSPLLPKLTTTSEGTDVASDILNGYSSSGSGSSSYIFDQNVYNILIERNLVATSTPEEMETKIKVEKGNADFRKGVDLPDGTHIMGMNELDNLAFERNVPIGLDPYLSEQKRILVKTITNNELYGQAWADSRSTINPQRYNNYANAWNEVVDNTSWRTSVGKDSIFLQTVEKYLEWRGKWQDILHERSSSNPAKGTLAQNPDIAGQYYDYVFYLKNEDKTGQFSEWYNRYFEGDTIN